MTAPERTEPRFARGARVRIEEENIRPWTGEVRSVKWSPVSGWWLEVQEDEGPGTYVVVETLAGEEER